MSDIYTPQKRSKIMASVRAKNTKPELIVRKALHAQGFRFRLHPKELPGKPDIVLKKYRVAVFVNGCFWHGHDCIKAKLPKTNTAFWRDKISKNKQRDYKNYKSLIELGWKLFLVWECQIEADLNKLINYLTSAKEKA